MYICTLRLHPASLLTEIIVGIYYGPLALAKGGQVKDGVKILLVRLDRVSIETPCYSITHGSTQFFE